VENAYCESLNGKLRMNAGTGRFIRLKEAQIVIEKGRVEYNLVSYFSPSLGHPRL
jgi:hypothetical protein